MKERGRTILSEIEPSYLRQRHLFSNRSFDLFGILGITKNISKLLYFREQYFQKFGTFLSGLELKDLTISYDLEAPNIFPSDPPTHLWKICGHELLKKSIHTGFKLVFLTYMYLFFAMVTVFVFRTYLLMLLTVKLKNKN